MAPISGKTALEDLFVAYRRDGELDALGRVHDLVSPQLHAFARRLAPARGDADDLVQATFLTAIERADTFDASRKLLPWLLGILAHHALSTRRAKNRSIDPERLALREVEDPARASAARELDEAARAALSELPTRYRDVLEPLLIHDERAAEVAARRGVSAGVVRMQVHRGLALLRRALPAGAALTGLAWLGRSRAQAATRRVVLDAARRRAGLPPAAVASGGLAAVPLAWPLVLAIGVALLATLWWFQRPDDQPLAHVGPVEAIAIAPPAALDPDGAAARGARSDVGAAVAPSTAVDMAASAALEAGSLELDVRWSDGSPAESVEMVVLHLDSPDTQRSARRGVTNARGRLLFRDCTGQLALRPDRGEQQTLEVGAHEQRRFEVELARGRDIDVRVVDTTGAPIEGAAIGFSSLHHFLFGAAIARTDARGLARLRDVPKNRRFVAWKSGLVCEKAVLAVGGAQEPDGRGVVELVLSRGAVELRGVVLGSDGRPAADADLRIGPQPTPREVLGCEAVALRTRTNRRGEYVFPAVPSGALELRARCADDAPWLETLVLVPGERRVHDVRLVPGASVHGMLEASELLASTGDGDGLDSVWICAGIPGTFEVVELRARVGEPYAVRGLRAGTHRIRAAGPLGIALSPELELGVGQAQALDLRLERALVLAGRLLERGAGRPLREWHVVALLATGGRAGYAQCDAQGGFELKGIAEEQVDLHFFAPGARAGQPERILHDVAVGQRDLLVELDPAGSD